THAVGGGQDGPDGTPLRAGRLPTPPTRCTDSNEERQWLHLSASARSSVTVCPPSCRTLILRRPPNGWNRLTVSSTTGAPSARGTSCCGCSSGPANDRWASRP